MSEEKEEVFEEKAVKEEAPVEIEVVERKPEPEVKDIEEVVEEPIKLAPVKKKRVISDAQRAQLALNLAKGRATSLLNRQKKSKLKAIEKEEKNKAEDTRIFENLKKKLKPQELEDENAMLRKELADLKAMKKTPTVKERGSGDAPEKKAERPTTPAPEEKKPEPKMISKPPAMSTRQKMRAMRGL